MSPLPPALHYMEQSFLTTVRAVRRLLQSVRLNGAPSIAGVGGVKSYLISHFLCICSHCSVSSGVNIGRFHRIYFCIGPGNALIRPCQLDRWLAGKRASPNTVQEGGGKSLAPDGS